MKGKKIIKGMTEEDEESDSEPKHKFKKWQLR